MKVVLTKSVQKLGREGEVKEVADGYARNFLIPRGLAALATAQKLAALRSAAAQRAAHDARRAAEAQKLSQKLAGLTLTLELPANAEGTLYAAVHARQLSEALQARGYTVSVGQIELPKEPIKRVGEHSVTIRCGPESRAQITLEVLRKT